MSKADGSQTNDLQRDALIAAGVDAAHFMRTGIGQTRRASRLTACLKALRPGDTLVVWKLDRLGRDSSSH
ncbi:recombinase family protein [Klebsiella pneumoniae]|uniref:Recombinase family protein n=1 Tax=Klebsiella pneumoniae TaxID=573 RepID=A0A939SUM0_KLEPN|nr:recombinase family protein [Klebsiella pneumoniae]